MRLRLGITCVLAALLAGCSNSPSGPSASESEGQAASTGAAALAPLDVLPDGFGPFDGEGFTIGAPGGFRRDDRRADNDEPMLVLVEADPGGPAPDLVAVLRVPDRRVSLEQGTDQLVDKLRDIDKAQDLQRTDLEWTNARDATLVTWSGTEVPEEPGGPAVDKHFWQLDVDIDGHLGFVVVVKAPVDRFEQSRVLDILRTFRPDLPAPPA